ncbi:bifunctional diguanylate cyclase/phosphodiesterase [Mycolicibacterium sp.]|uniref:putative bifunctional diguanylate cyclase/phosphodiesterase n=1 Tax=Mycolicibacterium sp. TaxID=2320850 RepID=UPI001A2A057F|nr:bifunctional diguanylate cyclase/phosphodiesterase [Mycolicibacterium sp.]MBJ7337058.1 bifunctional diguanylate cyclase/phosphodiesterase [Mycolicibacterium sp.]
MGRNSPGVRAAIALPIVAVLALAATLVVDGGNRAATAVDDLITVGLSTYATGCAVVAARSAEGRTRRAWATMAGALGAWALGDAMWLVYDLFLQRDPPSPSPADVPYLIFPVLAAVSLAQFAAVSTQQSRLRLVFDALNVALCLFLLSWVLVLNRLYDTYTDDKVTFSMALLYPALDLVVLTIAIVVLARADSNHRRVLSLLTLAICLVTIADTAYAYVTMVGRYDTGNLIDVIWAAALATLAVAAAISGRAPAARQRAVSTASNSSLWLPYVPLLLAGTVGPPLVMTGLERIIVPIIVVTICARQSVAAWENRKKLSAAADQALRDPLTGLANRTLFHERLTHAMMLRSRDDRTVTVVSLDLDDFKLVNDSLGHPAADGVLLRVGQRLLECVRTGDTVARVGGDEFAVLLEGCLDDSHLVVQHIVEAFNRPFTVDGQEMLMRPSVGLAAATPDEPDLQADTVIRRADIAMYAAKRSRSSEVHTFHAEMMLVDPDVVDRKGGPPGPAGDGAARIRLLGELRQAIDHGSLSVVYQPKRALDMGAVVGVEALLRWPHPTLGTLCPDAFLSLVRQHGLMRPVTDLVLDMVLDDVARWSAQGVRIPVAVNLFAPFLRDTHLPETLIRALERRGLPADLLTVEITEDLVLSEVAQVTVVLRRLREYGIKVAIDDFGSGYSALSYLRDLTIDEVKLDRHFIASVAIDTRAAAVVRAVIDLTHDLGITVVAEGVEDADTANWLRRHGCDVGQGYYFGRPVDAAQILELVRAAADGVAPVRG